MRPTHGSSIERLGLAVLDLNVDDGILARVRGLRDLDVTVRTQAFGDERKLVRGDGEADLRMRAVRELERAPRVLDPSEVLLADRRAVARAILLGVLPEPLREDPLSARGLDGMT